MVLRFFRPRAWTLDGLTPPWGERPSIHDAVSEQLRRATTSLYRAGMDLPDEALVSGDSAVRWAAGASDGVWGHHGGSESQADVGREVAKALDALSGSATDAWAAVLYRLLREHHALEYLDALLPRVARTRPDRAARVRAIARWLARQAPDREPVKAALGLLGVVGDAGDRELLMTLGRHEEFTLFSAAALTQREPDPDAVLWELGRHVTGWGRIHVVERLAATRSPEIRAWLLRDGCDNDIMAEYTAAVCARTGGLLEALRGSDPDDALLLGAGTILAALANGGPAEGMSAYADGAEATERYLAHARDRDLPLRHLCLISEIAAFAAAERAGRDDPAPGWPERAAGIEAAANAVLARDAWRTDVATALGSDDAVTFSTAVWAAKVLGIDAWDACLERVSRGGDEWYLAANTDVPERMDRVIALAEARLPLAAIASGPSQSTGLGPEFASHRALEAVLGGVSRFPGRGWPLIGAGLRNPVTRIRNQALRALAAWAPDVRPADTELQLRQALKAEPDEQTREMIRCVLKGAPLPK